MDPKLYVKGNYISRSIVTKALNRLLPKLQTKNDSTLLDIGCGDGSLLFTVLLEQLPFEYKHVIGVDISTKMVEFCKQSEMRKPNTDFYQMDIANPNISTNFINYFDYIFSFSALNWVPDQRKAFSNINKMLKSGGEILFLIHVSSQLYNSWQALQKLDPWKGYVNDEFIEQFISPYNRCENPENELNKLLGEFGFINGVVECKKEIFMVENRAIFKNFVRSLTVFLDEIPIEIRENYLEALVDDVIHSEKLNKTFNSSKEFVDENIAFYVNYLCVSAIKK